MVVVANTGINAPPLVLKFERLALPEGKRVTVIVSAFVLTPSWAVTIIIIKLGPTFNGMAPEAVPELTAAPFTVTAAVGSLVVGVTEIARIVLATDTK